MGILDTAINVINSVITDMSSDSQPISSLNKVYNTKFTTSNFFDVKTFYNSYFESKSGIGQSDFIHFCKTYMQGFTLSEIVNQDIEEWVNYKWNYTPGKPNINRITFTFRDNSDYFFYTHFKSAWWSLKDRLPDEQKWSININSVNDYNNHLLQSSLSPNKKVNGSSLININDAIIESISGVSLDKTNPNSFVTFNVTFRYFINYVN